MSRKSIIFGALVNAGAGDDIFPCDSLSKYDMILDKVQENSLLDKKAADYLEETLSLYSEVDEYIFDTVIPLFVLSLVLN